jgi:hypothetical protein
MKCWIRIRESGSKALEKSRMCVLHSQQTNQSHLSEGECFGYMKISYLGCVQTVFAVAASRENSALTALCPMGRVARLYEAPRPVGRVARLYGAPCHVGRVARLYDAPCHVGRVARLYGAPCPVGRVARLYGASRPVGRVARLYGAPRPADRVARLYGAPRHAGRVARLYGAPRPVGRVARLYVALLRLDADVPFFIDGAFLFYVRTGGLVVAFLLWDGG